MAGSKRERELARAKYERQQARRAEAAAKRRRRNTIIAVVAGVVVLAGGLLWFLRPSGTTAADSSPSASPSAQPTESGSSSIACTDAPQPRADDKRWDTAPKRTLGAAAKPVITFTTNCGPIVVETEPTKAPTTVNAMVFLTQQGYYDLTACHRLTTQGIFVLQCGDPKGDGTGGPGFALPDENLPKAGSDNYPAGTVAMANAGPGTSGSQFFLVYQNTTLPPSYTIWGKITSGLDVVRYVAAKGVQGGGADGTPNQPVVIVKATATGT